MKDLIKRISALAVFCTLLFTFSACLDITGFETVTDSGLEIVTESGTATAADDTVTEAQTATTPEEERLPKDGSYTRKEDVALYLKFYGKLPSNFITKEDAKKLGWPGGGLDGYADGKCIGGDYFGNYDGKLPKKQGRKYYECDIDTLGADSRGDKRIVYSNDGLIFYTGDHYETFEQLY
ncbi:MAG: ribonuclease [Clostridia bacterium]|nr:ribonuclease [Clostridia bacterium]